jgi:hypothetical protein
LCLWLLALCDFHEVVYTILLTIKSSLIRVFKMEKRKQKAEITPYIKYTFISVISVLTLAWFLNTPNNYEECMLKSMKGQQSAMYMTAHESCAKKFRKIQSIPLDGIRFSISDDKNILGSNKIKILLTENSSEYHVTEATIAFSQKDCENSLPSDFVLTKTIQINNNKAFIPYENDLEEMTEEDLLLSNSTSNNCSKIIELKGTYK